MLQGCSDWQLQSCGFVLLSRDSAVGELTKIPVSRETLALSTIVLETTVAEWSTKLTLAHVPKRTPLSSLRKLLSILVVSK